MSASAPLFRSELGFSSATGEWGTPQAFFDQLNAEFHFELDACATPENAKCPSFYTVDLDGLKMPWAPRRVFCNPPYGRGIGAWMAKARLEADRGATVVCLVPARTDTGWWWDNIMGRAEIRFIRGRLHFTGAGIRNAAPFPSAVVVFRPEAEGATQGDNAHA